MATIQHLAFVRLTSSVVLTHSDCLLNWNRPLTILHFCCSWFYLVITSHFTLCSDYLNKHISHLLSLLSHFTLFQAGTQTSASTPATSYILCLDENPLRHIAWHPLSRFLQLLSWKTFVLHYNQMFHWLITRLVQEVLSIWIDMVAESVCYAKKFKRLNMNWIQAHWRIFSSMPPCMYTCIVHPTWRKTVLCHVCIQNPCPSVLMSLWIV